MFYLFVCAASLFPFPSSFLFPVLFTFPSEFVSHSFSVSVRLSLPTWHTCYLSLESAFPFPFLFFPLPFLFLFPFHLIFDFLFCFHFLFHFPFSFPFPFSCSFPFPFPSPVYDHNGWNTMLSKSMFHLYGGQKTGRHKRGCFIYFSSFLQEKKKLE